MVFRLLLGNVLREAAQAKLGEVVSGQQAPVELPERCDVAVMFALGIEAGGLFDLLEDVVSVRGQGYVEHFGQLNDLSVVIVETGVGQESAARAAASFIPARRPDWVISAGFAGGLVEDLPIRHFLMADSIANTQGQSLSTGLFVSKESLAATPGVHVGRLLTVDHLVRSPDEKRQLAAQHQAVACDMESMAIAQVCQQTKVRMLSVRIISDAVDDVLPPEIEKLLDQQSTAATIGAAVGALWQRPSSAKDMWHLKQRALRASDRLGHFIEGVTQHLPRLGD